MKEYIVSTKLTTNVEAESREKAEEKAEEDFYDRPDLFEFESASAKALDPENLEFFVEINEAGHQKLSTGYKTIRSKSALEALWKLTKRVAHSLTNGEDADRLRYELAIILLSTVEGDATDPEKIQEKVEAFKEEARDKKQQGFDKPYAEVAKESMRIKKEEQDGEEESE